MQSTYLMKIPTSPMSSASTALDRSEEATLAVHHHMQSTYVMETLASPTSGASTAPERSSSGQVASIVGNTSSSAGVPSIEATPACAVGEPAQEDGHTLLSQSWRPAEEVLPIVPTEELAPVHEFVTYSRRPKAQAALPRLLMPLSLASRRISRSSYRLQSCRPVGIGKWNSQFQYQDVAVGSPSYRQNSTYMGSP